MDKLKLTLNCNVNIYDTVTVSSYCGLQCDPYVDLGVPVFPCADIFNTVYHST